ncbi:cytidylate kinase-like family protein [Candidatus Woesebacteria bacterium]|nr:cytidylate kinase-like family protein [Candidatus Woesebacteria bacterium]
MTDNNYSLVNKLVNLFNLRERLSHLEADADSSFVSPFITVGREPGSGGAPIAQAVAEKLGFEFVDEQIVEEIARSTKRRKEIIREIDEKSRTKIEDVIHSLLNTEYVAEVDYVSELVRVILAYAYKGKTVILGRGANFVTPFARGLHVNIMAPYKVRVQRAMDFEGHSEPKAKEVIAKVEKERKEFVQQYFKKDVTKPNSYDLTINTTYFRVPEARDIVIAAFRQKFPQTQLVKNLLK